MDRINTATKALDLFGPGKHGFKDGNLSLAIQPTTLEAAFFNDLQEELIGVIEGAGLVPTAGVRTQLRQAIEVMISGSTGNDYKASVRVATTANIASLNGGAPNTLDGIALAADNRILVKDQATPSQNGIYYVATLGTGANGIWLRAVDADGAGEMTAGMLVAVEEGTAQADTLWMVSTDGPITIGTTAIQFVRRDSGAANTNQLASGSVTASAGALTATLDPSTTDFRSATATSGARTSVTSVSALSLTVPSGATLGVPANTSVRLYILEINNAGVKEPAIVYQTGGVSMNEEGVISTTALSGASNSANVVYSAVARASVPYRLRLYFDVTLSVPGTWVNPTLVQPVGGQAGAAMHSLGFGQTWQTPTRSVGTTYYNTTGKPIQVFIRMDQTSGGNAEFRVNGVNVVPLNGTAAPYMNFVFAIIPPGASYAVITTANPLTLVNWNELR